MAVAVAADGGGSDRGEADAEAACASEGAEATAAGGDGDVASELAELGDWICLVINLERRADRYEQMERLLSTTNPRVWQRVERIDAVDGREMSFDDPDMDMLLEPTTLERARRAKDAGLYTVVHDTDNLLVHFDDHLTEGAVACAMSHHKALEHLANHPTAEWALILEDDNSVVVPEVDRAIARVLRQLPNDWEAVYLGYHDDDGKPHPRGLRAGEAPDAAPGGDDVVEVQPGGVYRQCWGLFAWMVKKETAQKLVDSLFPLSTQVDGAISSWLIRVYGPGRVFKVPAEELLFYSSCSEEAQDSDIQTMALEEKVVEEYGSWNGYMDRTRQPSSYGYDEEFLADLFGDYGYGGDGDYGGDDDAESYYDELAQTYGENPCPAPTPTAWDET